jgi:2-oxoglutarate ferredoxin oxidoreductase subunit beta
MTEKDVKDENVLYLQHGKPLVYGKNKDKGIRMNGSHMEVIQLGNGLSADDCLVWDESLDNPATAFLAAQLLPPDFPTALGIFRAVDMPSYEERVGDQMRHETDRLGVGKLDDLLKAGDTWVVPEEAAVS